MYRAPYFDYYAEYLDKTPNSQLTFPVLYTGFQTHKTKPTSRVFRLYKPWRAPMF